MTRVCEDTRSLVERACAASLRNLGATLRLEIGHHSHDSAMKLGFTSKRSSIGFLPKAGIWSFWIKKRTDHISAGLDTVE